METITFTCKVITPMFLAGADGQTPELRAPSIKGAMRFWWRAMNGHLVKKDEYGKWDYSELKKREEEIFGGTSSRSKFSLSVDWINWKIGKLPLPDSKIKVGQFNNDLFKFMTYGLWDNRDPSQNRAFIGYGSTFKLTILIEEESLKNDILKSFHLLVNHGGVGAKARNGFGGFSVVKPSVIDNFSINLDFSTTPIKEFSCFSNESKVHELGEDTSWIKALAMGLHSYVDVKKNFSTEEKNLIAAHNPRCLTPKLEKKPKFFFVKILESTSKNHYACRVTFLPYLLPTNDEALNVLKKFRDNLINYEI